MSFTSAEPLSGLSVIPEATEENRGSTFFVARPLPKPIESKKEVRAVAETSNAYHSHSASSSREGDMSEFKAAFVGKQPYASCCCILF